MIGHQHGGGRGDGVHHADHRLLRDVPAPAPAERQDHGARWWRQRVGVGLPGLRVVAEEERWWRWRRDLRHRDIHEDDLAREHVDAEVGVDPGEDQAHEKGRPQNRDQLVDHCCSALTSVVML
jgi:hypothetical protein